MFASDGPTERLVEDPVATLAAGLDALAGRDLAALDDTELVSQTLRLEQQASRMDAERIRRLGEIDARKAWSIDGSRSAAAWLSRRSGMGHGEANRRFTAARSLRDLPQVGAAFAEGRLSLSQVRAFAQLVHDGSEVVREALPGAEELLVGTVAGLGERETRKVLRFWWARVDPEGYQDRWNDLYEKRGLFASETFEGSVAVDGTLDPDQGQLFLRALSALEELLWRQDQEAVARGELCSRTAAQRRADALALMAEITLDHLAELLAAANGIAGATDDTVSGEELVDEAATVEAVSGEAATDSTASGEASTHDPATDDPATDDPATDGTGVAGLGD